MRNVIAFFLLIVFCSTLVAADRPVRLKIHPPKAVPQSSYQEYLEIRPSLLFDIGTPADTVLGYRPSKNLNAITYDHYRWMMYRPSDYKVTGTPRPRPSDLINVSTPVPHR